MVGALQGPADRDERAGARHAAGERAQRFRRDPGQLRGPLRSLGAPVVEAEHVAFEPLEADAVSVQERPVVQPLGDQRVRETEHHGGVGPGDERMPLDGQKLRQVVAHGAEEDELHAAVGGGAQVLPHGMSAQAA